MTSGHLLTRATYKKLYVVLTMSIPLFLMGWPIISGDSTYMIAWLGFFGYLIFFLISIFLVFLIKEKNIKYFVALAPFIYLLILPFGRPLYLFLSGHTELAKDAILPFYGYVVVYGVVYLIAGYVLIAISWILWRRFFSRLV